MADGTQSFLGAEDRPDVYTLLDKPIRDLTPRELAEVFAALGVPTEQLSSTIGEGDLEEPIPPEEFPVDPCAWDIAFEHEQIMTELIEAGAPEDQVREMDWEELVAAANTYNISAATQGRIGGIKKIIDKARRDKPRIDKGIKDGKAAADKFIKDGKSTVDKTLSDGKTWVDKQLADKGRVKDALDAKEIKDLFEGAVVTPTNDTPNVDQLAKQVEMMRLQFEEISKSLQQLQSGQ